MSIETAKQQTITARQQLETQRQQVAEQEELVRKQKEKLEEARKRLPENKSQRAIRESGGLQGREKRREIERVKKQIQTQRGVLESGESQLSQYKTELTKYEREQIIPVEQEIQDYERRQQSLGIAQIYYESQLRPNEIDKSYDPSVRELAQEYLGDMYAQKKVTLIGLQRDVQAFEKENPTEELFIDTKNLRIEGVRSGALGGFFGVKDYNKKIEEINRVITTPQVIPEITSPSLEVKERTRVGKIFQAFGDVPFYETTLKSTVKDIPRNIIEVGEMASKIPVGIPEFEKSTTRTGLFNSPLTVKPSTVGKQAEVLFRDYPSMLGGESSKGYSQAFFSLGIEERKVKYNKEGKPIKIVTTPAGFFTKGVKYVPSVIGYSVPVYGSVAFGYDFFKVGSEMLPENIKEESKRLASERYKNYIGDASRREYLEQVVPQYEEQLPKIKTKELAIMGGVVLGGIFLSKGLGIIKNQKVIRDKRIVQDIKEKIVDLKDKKFESFTVVDEGSGKISLIAERNVEGAREVITQKSFLKSTLGGFKFIPTGKALSTLNVKSSPFKVGLLNIKSRMFQRQQFFNTGSKGKNIPKGQGQLGDIKFFEEIGESTSIPKKYMYSKLIKVEDERVAKEFLEDFFPLELGKKRYPKEVIYKDISFPVISINGGLVPVKSGVNTLVEVNKFLSVRINPSELGVILTIPKKETKSMLGFSGGGKKSSTQYFEDLYKVQDLKVSEIKNFPTTPSNTLKNVRVPLDKGKSTTSFITAKVVSREQSAYIGTGLYERTEGYSVTTKIFAPSKIDMIQDNVMVSESNITSDIGKLNLIGISKEKTKDKLNFNQPSKLKYISIQSPKERLKENIAFIPKQELKLKQDVKIIQQQKPKQQQKQQQKPKQQQKQQQKPKPKEKGKIPFKWLQGVKEKLNKDEKIFTAFVKKAGKEVDIGKTKTKEEAESLLRTKLIKTLRASGGIKFGEERLKASELNLGLEFKPSKLNRFLVVEEKQKRLRKGTTGKEIQYFRPSGGKKKKSWF